MGILANQLPTWIVEPTNSATGADGYEARKIRRTTDTTTHYGSTAAKQLFQDIATDMMSTKGGKVVIKNGTYIINGAASGNIWGFIDFPPDDTDGLDYQIVLEGESRDGTIIKNSSTTAVDDILFTFHGHGVLKNLTFDGDSLSTSGLNLLQFHNSDNPYDAGFIVENCRFRKHTGIGLLTDNARYVELINNYFELPEKIGDQAAIGQSEGYCKIYGNVFERLTGSGELDGSSLTSGCMQNGIICNNIIKREPGHIVHGISLEPFDSNPDYDNVVIHNNIVQHGQIKFGGLGAWGTTFRNIHIRNNDIYGAGAGFLGPTSGDTSTQIMDCSITDNKMYYPYYSGLHLAVSAGQVIVARNEIVNSNIAVDATTFDKGAVYIEDTVDLILEDNRITMGVLDVENPDYCPLGIKTVGTQHNFTMQENRIKNNTVANPSYQLSGSFTGTKRISMDR
jgi:hypothetical protein